MENEILALKSQRIQNKILQQKNTFTLIILFEKMNNFHKVFTMVNPVFVENNEKIYFGDSEVLFSMQFGTKKECNNAENHILGILKMQKTHIEDDYFDLKPKHFQILEMLKIS